jgi:hypothetical protein
LVVKMKLFLWPSISMMHIWITYIFLAPFLYALMHHYNTAI